MHHFFAFLRHFFVGIDAPSQKVSYWEGSFSRYLGQKSLLYKSYPFRPPTVCCFLVFFSVAVGGELIAPTSKWLSHDAKVAAGKEAPERFAHVDIEKCTHSQRHQKHNLTQKHHPATSGQATRVTETHQKDLMLSQEIPQKQTIFRFVFAQVIGVPVLEHHFLRPQVLPFSEACMVYLPSFDWFFGLM